MYPFLGASALFGIIWILIWYGRPDLRRALWFGSLVSTPLGLTQPLFVPGYWEPTVILQIEGWDIESLIWSFFMGGIAAVIFEVIWSKRLVRSKPHKPKWLEIVLLIAGFAAVVVGAWYLNFSTLHSCFIVASAVILALWKMRPDLVKPSILGGLLFTLIYIVVLLLAEHLSRGFLNQWNPSGNWGIAIHGIPLEEYLFAFLFTAWWSLLYPIAAGLSIQRAKKS